MNRFLTSCALGALLAAGALGAPMTAQPALAAAPAAAAPGSYAQAIAGLERHDGLLTVYVDKAKGRVLLALPAPDKDGVAGRFLYQAGLRTGFGSASSMLDRGRLAETQVLAFRRVGGKVVAEYENPRFRATGVSADEADAAKNSFATSLVWAGPIAATAPDGGLLVDVTSFLTRDVINAPEGLKHAGEKGFKLSADLSMADVDKTKVFPENIELDAIETFTSDTPGAEARDIAPDPKVITLSVHHSLIKLPEPGFEPRKYDPRTGGLGAVIVDDYGAPLGGDIVYRYARRFRLEKTDPTAAKSPVKKPIVFYVDRGAPEEVRKALIEGINWWNQAFEAAGFIGAFRAEEMPEGADPMDVRYNVVNWGDRATRGWSYGQSVVDPRTGEIIRGDVVLGALRVRQDILIFEGLAGADKVGTGDPNDPVQAALARIRQLGAHEVGHAIGFTHNFAASTQDRDSVMDYPPPRIKLTDGKIDLSDAYAVGIGDWDKFTVDWLYGTVPAGAAGQAALDAKARAMVASGRRFIDDVDGRPLGVGQPWASLWDDGVDPAAELDRMMKVRRVALDGFGLSALKPNEPLANLRRKFVPIYLLHRYQVEAAAKLVGGVDFAYAVKGDPKMTSAPVDVAMQRHALEAMVSALAPAELDTPPGLVPLLSAGFTGTSDRQFDIEVFDTMGGPVFDPLVAADVGAGIVYDQLLARDRLARLVEQHRVDPSLPGAGEVLDKLVGAVFPAKPAAGRLAAIQRREQTRLVMDMAAALADPKMSPAAAAEIDARLTGLGQTLKAKASDPAEQAHRQRLAGLISDREALEKLATAKDAKPETPPGMPIGDDGDW
ncbi:zinc-dependent metalloprotease [Phenylobacterium sp.]|uniref:zinc-dependent metalloprotease n=1 Tax=Phenylobacterium sp. TaxID=1871053 RepID=UPI0035B42612